MKELRPEHFYNRELSWLEFNERVIEEAFDKSNPLLERFKFLAIASSNLDEFIMIRVAGLKAQIDAGYKKTDIAGYTAKQQLNLVEERIREMLHRQGKCLNRSLLPLLNEEKIYFKKYNDLTKEQREFLDMYFEETVFPILTPMAIDNSRPFPFLLNKSLNIAVKLHNHDKEEFFSVVQVPSILKRYIELPNDGYSKDFIMLEELIIEKISALFEGYKVKVSNPFRITRNGDLNIDEEEAEDLLIEIEKSLKKRKRGFPVRLEVNKDIDKSLRKFLLEALKIREENIFEIAGFIDLTFLFSFIFSIDGTEHLLFENRKPLPAKVFYQSKKNIFDIIKEKDVLLHHPYDSFEHVVDLVKQAGKDLNVLAIKQTLYRVSGDSPIVHALINAAEKGKQVTVLIELKARFDEERNISWAKKLEKSGCHVVYGLRGLKTHAKVLLVVRREEDGIRRYAHFSTGNYNDSTAKLYTDMGMFTSKESYCSDASNLFNILTGYALPSDYNKLYLAPFNLRDKFKTLINQEIKMVKEGKEGKIIAKMNSLVDKEIIEELYKAANAGVKIELIIRGICCLRTDIEEITKNNIKVLSIVGRYLEHTRIFYFENGGNTKIFLSSADWMTRNLNRRIETMFPVEENDLKDEICYVLNSCLNDTEKCRVQSDNGKYIRIDRRGKSVLNSQEELYKRNKDAIDNIKEELKKEIIQIV